MIKDLGENRYGRFPFQCISTFFKKGQFLTLVTLSCVLINFFRHFHHNSISRKNDHKQRFFFKLRHSKWQNCCCCRIQSTKSSKERGASYGYFVRTVGHNLTAGQNVGTDVEEMNLGIIAQVKPVEQKKEKK